MGRGSSKVGGTTGGARVGLTPSEVEQLHDRAMASLVWRDNYGGTNLTTPQEREQYGTPFGGGSQFEETQFQMLRNVAERNNIENEFTFNEVRAEVRTPDGRFRVLGDDYAIARGLTERSWIVNEFDTNSRALGGAPIIEQTRYSTPEAALDYIVRRRRGK